jgi:serine protease AprX
LSHHFNWIKKLSPILRTFEFAKPDEYHRVMVELSRKKTEIIVSNIVNGYQGRINRKINLVPILAVEIPFPAIKKLAQLKHVKRIWFDPRLEVQLSSTPSFDGALKMDDAEFTGKNVTVAVLDTGIYPHRDLTSSEKRIVAWRDLINQTPLPYDDNGHGTHIAGVIAGNGFTSRNKFRGIAPDAKLVGIKILDKNGRGYLADLIAGIEWCIQNRSTYNIKIINLPVSLATQDVNYNDPLSRIITMASRKRIVICAAAGVDSLLNEAVPFTNPGVIMIGNRDDRYILSSDMKHIKPVYYKHRPFEQYAKPDLLAPGTRIVSLKVRGGYCSLTGASVSTALISGVIAQLLEVQPYLKPSQIKKILKKNAVIFNLGPNREGIEILNTAALFYHTKCKRNRKQKPVINEQCRKGAGAGARQNIILRNKYTLGVNPYILFLVFVLLVFSFSPRCH